MLLVAPSCELLEELCELEELETLELEELLELELEELLELE